jgi:hypothetical protein
MRFFLSPIVFVIGILLMRYTVQVTNMTGKLDWAEKYLGGGLLAGTYTWWRLCGLGLCILSVLWLFNLLPHGA